MFANIKFLFLNFWSIVITGSYCLPIWISAATSGGLALGRLLIRLFLYKLIPNSFGFLNLSLLKCQKQISLKGWWLKSMNIGFNDKAFTCFQDIYFGTMFVCLFIQGFTSLL